MSSTLRWAAGLICHRGAAERHLLHDLAWGWQRRTLSSSFSGAGPTVWPPLSLCCLGCAGCDNGCCVWKTLLHLDHPALPTCALLISSAGRPGDARHAHLQQPCVDVTWRLVVQCPTSTTCTRSTSRLARGRTSLCRAAAHRPVRGHGWGWLRQARSCTSSEAGQKVFPPTSLPLLEAAIAPQNPPFCLNQTLHRQPRHQKPSAKPQAGPDIVGGP